MKRVFVAWSVVAVILLSAVAASRPVAGADDSTATIAALQTKVAKQATSIAKRDDKIDTQRTQIADLHATVSALQTQVPTAVVASDIFTFTGNGQQTTDMFAVGSGGLYKMTLTIQEDRYASVSLYDRAGDRQYDFEILASNAGSFTKTGRLSPGYYYIEVSANISWTVTLEPFS